MSVCGRDDSTHCRLRKDGEAVLLEEYKQIDGAHTFRDPVFPKTGGAWPHLYHGRTKIPELQNARVYVISLPDAEKRRHHFAGEWAALDLDIPAVWVEAVNGR